MWDNADTIYLFILDGFYLVFLFFFGFVACPQSVARANIFACIRRAKMQITSYAICLILIMQGQLILVRPLVRDNFATDKLSFVLLYLRHYHFFKVSQKRMHN